ncbi:UDP-glycosyltransferase UGT4-like [Mercenaria mercenaria]|uniref:UDP-glycosyltransferase UGT4-like n=1 Tax=Mercenaria mercenaria TaxID=6596 RepID=UPI00234EA3CD|nr:UDP-glycosyltransferase UGT4-like [Mercenaria mercenaria]XP_045163478.2 UDP-glycosyltransferase UGT4-like [Mercenaria mercenaria]XP_045163479.2 UDP-glycosyltransferase UGT4-like [Mercenaria mercenaria]
MPDKHLSIISKYQRSGCRQHTLSCMVILCLFIPLLSSVDSVTMTEEASTLSGRSIFMYLPMTWRSHQVIFRSVAEALTERGHHVTMVVSANMESELSGQADNYDKQITNGVVNEIRIQFNNSFSQLVSMLTQDISQNEGSSFYREMLMLKTGFELISKSIRACHMAALSHSIMQEMLQENRKTFDLVIVPALFNEIGYFLAKKFNAPLILLMPFNANPILTLAMGYSDNPAFVKWSFNKNGQSETPGFLTRLINFIFFNAFGSVKTLMWLDTQNDVLRELNLLQKDVSIDFLQLERNASFGMYSTHYLFDAVRPTLPNTVDIGFIHCRPARALQADLADWFDEADEEIVYLSLGSIVSFDSIDESIQKAITGIFADTKYRFLLRSSTFKSDQRNVRTCVWCPQQDILGHPKAVLFVSHGGLRSIEETLYHGVPILIMPFFSADGLSNSRRAERQGYGLTLNISLNRASGEISRHLLHKIDKMLDINANYTLRAKQLGNLVRDDIRTPAEKAVFWSEYVMRHAGADHIKSPARTLVFFNFFNVDIFLFFGVMSFLFSLFLFCVLRAVLIIAWKLTLKALCGMKNVKRHLKQD